MLAWVAYAVLSVLWAVYAWRMQRALYPGEPKWKEAAVVALNLVAAPVCLIIAIIRLPMEAREPKEGS